ncbi:hypothetical protein JRQ81_000011 [Phrynocephalus forsythii]|uniref:Uncharacterized protein n=1 Tax=Phrynocephalus forsythii TaxID=171643 RepID=A0A9Q1APS4_9SAUR|nr:hypothetical protein JRQ81_000011 [Phrynocephalus forsythii]
MNRPRSARSPVSLQPPTGGSGKYGICPVRTPHHPDCRRTPTDHGSDWHPSRKEPPSGHVHVRYDDPDGRTATAPIEMNQEYRHPDSACPWADPPFLSTPPSADRNPVGSHHDE